MIAHAPCAKPSPGLHALYTLALKVAQELFHSSNSAVDPQNGDSHRIDAHHLLLLAGNTVILMPFGSPHTGTDGTAASAGISR